MRSLCTLFLLLSATGACRTDEATTSATATGSSTVRFELSDGPMDWGDVPFPSDLYWDAEGRFIIADLPGSKNGEPVYDALRDTLALRGACTTCALHAYVDGGVDPASVMDSVALVNLHTGRSIPLTTQWDADTDRLSVRPLPGEVLPRDTPHALVLTSDLLGTDGLPVEASPTLRHLLAARDPRLEPAMASLEALGFSRDEVVGLAPFTTDDPTHLLRAIAGEVAAAARAEVIVEQVWVGDAIDELLGLPAEDRPGGDVPPLTEGTRAVRHDTTAVVVAGTFTAPRFVQGAGADVGPLHLVDGLPNAHTTEEVPFLLIVPEGSELSALPVAVVHHGFNASRTSAFVLADTLGEAGMAVLAIDGFQHGARAASAADTSNSMRNLEGPDGFAETFQLDVSGRMFGLLGAEPGMAFSADLPLAAFTQLSADALSTIRLAREGDWTPLHHVPELEGLAIDPDRIAFVGNSMGAVVGTGVLAADPDLEAAVLNVLPGSIVDTLVESGEFRPLTEAALLDAVGIDGSFDEVERRLAMDPIVDLYRWALEPVDPMALAPSLADRPILVQLAGHDEVAPPGPSEAAVDAATLPATRYDDAMHGMMEVLLQESTFDTPLVQPLQERDESLILENPIRAVHDEIEAYISDFVATGEAHVDEAR